MMTYIHEAAHLQKHFQHFSFLFFIIWAVYYAHTVMDKEMVKECNLFEMV